MKREMEEKNLEVFLQITRFYFELEFLFTLEK